MTKLDENSVLVPVAGTNTFNENKDLPSPVRDLCEEGSWAYPEDVPSHSMRQHPKPRRPWSLRDFFYLVLWCLLALWLGVAVAIGQEREIDGMGGGSFSWAFPIVLGVVEDGQPIRLSGRFTSAGTFMLYAVDQLPGSCIDPRAYFDFHEPQQPASAFIGCAPFGMDHPQRDAALEHVHRWYNEPLTAWFLSEIAGDRAECGYTTLRGHQMAAFRYPVCGEAR